jgi:hypothetical protein
MMVLPVEKIRNKRPQPINVALRQPFFIVGVEENTADVTKAKTAAAPRTVLK